MASIGENICNRRKELGMTQEELAELLGYKSKSSINKIELGVNDLPQRKIAQFAKVLHTTPAALMGWESVTPGQKKNDAMVDVVARMRKDPEFFDVVSMLAELPADQYASIKQLISALGNK